MLGRSGALVGAGLAAGGGADLAVSFLFRLVSAGAAAGAFLGAGLALALGALRAALAGGGAALGLAPGFALAALLGGLAIAVPLAALGLGLAFPLAALCGLLGAAACGGRASGGLKVTMAGPPAAAFSVISGVEGKGADAGAGFGAGDFVGASTTRSSGTSARLSCQGRAKPGSPKSWPPNVRLSRRAWNSSESSSAMMSRLPWRLASRNGGKRTMAGSASDAGCWALSDCRAPVAVVEFKRRQPVEPGWRGGGKATWPQDRRSSQPAGRARYFCAKSTVGCRRRVMN